MRHNRASETIFFIYGNLGSLCLCGPGLLSVAIWLLLWLLIQWCWRAR